MHTVVRRFLLPLTHLMLNDNALQLSGQTNLPKQIAWSVNLVMRNWNWASFLHPNELPSLTICGCNNRNHCYFPCDSLMSTFIDCFTYIFSTIQWLCSCHGKDAFSLSPFCVVNNNFGGLPAQSFNIQSHIHVRFSHSTVNLDGMAVWYKQIFLASSRQVVT